jgi:hypothetical protein
VARPRCGERANLALRLLLPTLIANIKPTACALRQAQDKQKVERHVLFVRSVSTLG